MKILISENQLNTIKESVLGDINRLNPNRKENDQKAITLFNEIVDDFIEHGKDWKKLIIHDNGGTKLSINELQIGKQYDISYVFGKYHPINRDPHTGNREHGDRRIKISTIPFTFTLKKNELEKMFNTSRINLSRTTVIDTNSQHNFDRNKPGRLNTKEDEYKISVDIANKLFNYFINQWNQQFPDLKFNSYKGNMVVKDIEKNVPPVIKWITVINKDRENLMYDLRKGEDENNIKNIIKNLSKKEYDVWYKDKQNNIYKQNDEKYNNNKEILTKLIDNLFKQNNIILKPDDWNKYGFTFKAFIPDYEFIVEFRYPNDITNQVKQMLVNDVNGYKGSLERVSEGILKEKYIYYTIVFTKD